MSELPFSENQIVSQIHLFRGQKVMLDSDLAALYSVETRRLNEQVRRNIDRFPVEFMFQLTETEFKNLKSQFATSSWGGRRKLPFFFTEHGAVMLAAVLNSPTAIQASIFIVKVFVRLRQVLESHRELADKIKQLEIDLTGRLEGQDEKIARLFEVLKQLIQMPEPKREPIGFKK